jgi:hypothetical protein
MQPVARGPWTAGSLVALIGLALCLLALCFVDPLA